MNTNQNRCVCTIQYRYGGESTMSIFVFSKKRALDDEEGGMGWLGEGEGWGWGWGWGMGDGRWGVVVSDVVARYVQHTK